MKLRVSKKHILDILFPLGLLLIFVSSAVLVLLLAANVYGDITETSARTNEGRTVTAYLTEKIHQNDRSGAVYVEDINGLNTLVLEHPGDQATYCTYIYYYNNSLRELLTRKDSVLGPESGKEIMPLQSFEGTQVKDNLFRFLCKDTEGREVTAWVSLRSGRE